MLFRAIPFMALFVAVAFSFSRVNNPISKLKACQFLKQTLAMSAVLPSAPSTDKARLRLKVSGPSVSSALFRAELKKEICFYRGCRAEFIHNSQEPNEAEIVCEGKTLQISRFLEWMKVLSTDISQRKANFQGPSLVAYVIDAQWQDFKGDIPAGFVATDEAPSLSDGSADGSTMEARNMAGTDESV
jgi:hypothetical protein